MWSDARKRALKRLYDHMAMGLVDEDIAAMLVRVNEAGNAIFTSSSCSGRIAVFLGHDFMDKHGTYIWWSTHDPRECFSETCFRAETASKITTEGLIAWVSLQAPIIQAQAKTLEVAGKVLDCALKSGFARAGMRIARGGWFIVEASVRDKVHIVLPVPCNVVLQLCSLLSRYKERVYRMLECLEKVNREASPGLSFKRFTG